MAKSWRVRELVNVIIVLGAYQGEAIDAFYDAKKIDNSWKVVCYEPNKNAVEILSSKYPQAIIHTKAVHTHNGTIDYRISSAEQKNGISSNIPDVCSTEVIECIDIDDILDTLDNYEQVIMRIDIEGSEYDVIPKLIEHKNLKKITELYLEWHTTNNEHVDIELLNKKLIKNIPVTLIATNDGTTQHRILTTHKC